MVLSLKWERGIILDTLTLALSHEWERELMFGSHPQAGEGAEVWFSPLKGRGNEKDEAN